MWWAFQRSYVCGTWSLTLLGKLGCGHGLGNSSALVSEFCRDPLDFIEVYDENTHEKREFGKGQKPTFMLKHCLFSCSLLRHMLASILPFLFTCHARCWCFCCNWCDFCVSFFFFKKHTRRHSCTDFRVKWSWSKLWKHAGNCSEELQQGMPIKMYTCQKHLNNEIR